MHFVLKIVAFRLPNSISCMFLLHWTSCMVICCFSDSWFSETTCLCCSSESIVCLFSHHSASCYQFGGPWVLSHTSQIRDRQDGKSSTKCQLNSADLDAGLANQIHEHDFSHRDSSCPRGIQIKS